MTARLQQYPVDESNNEKQVQSLLSGICQKYGFDFSQYAPASFRRRLSAVLRTEGLSTLEELEELILTDTSAFHRFVHGLSVNVTSMFRDPPFYKVFRQEVVPILATYPFIRIWHAGCSTGEEVYSVAIVLQETGLYDRARIYATDIDAVSLEQAKEGVFSLESMKEYSSNYLASGGPYSLSNYYTANHDCALFRASLKRNIVFAQHNLVSDSSFNEFHLVICRNVLIYFNSELRDKVLALFHDSLVNFGVLALGASETLRFSGLETCYQQFGGTEKIYKRVV